MGSSSANGDRGAPASSAEHFRFELPGRLEYREAVRAFLAHVCDHLQRNDRLPADAGHRVISAFVEAFNNTVIHAYEDQPHGPVHVELEITEEYLTVRVMDEGKAFVLEEVPEPDLAALPEGGLGLFIIRNFMDDVGYERRGDRNVLTMVKRFEPAPGDGPEPT